MEKILAENNIKEISLEILNKLKTKASKNASILTMSGELGTGKTALTKEIAKHLGVKERIISPTFVIMKSYKTKDKKFRNLIHIDAYRLNSSQELLNLGWKEITDDKENLIIVEWPERVSACIPEGCSSLTLEHRDDTTRNIKF